MSAISDRIAQILSQVGNSQPMQQPQPAPQIPPQAPPMDPTQLYGQVPPQAAPQQAMAPGTDEALTPILRALQQHSMLLNMLGGMRKGTESDVADAAKAG